MKKIMIVDDEQVSLLMTNHILSTAYQTYMASSGMEAVDVFEKENPDMVLSDLRMPGMSGLELKQRLSELYGRQIPFMFMTADHDDETESKGFENGAMDFIRKPFRADVLLRRVDNILQTVEKLNTLKSAAETDRLTGLLNKVSAVEEIDALCHNSQGSLMMIDLDSFKLVNDLYGHEAGDKLLVAFADILRSVVRSNDVLGRIGGDEFIAFCQKVSEEPVIAGKAAYINDRLIEAAKDIMGQDMNIPLGASIGCVFAPDEGSDYPTLFKKADKALYNVKQNGKHGYRIYRDMETGDGREQTVASDIANMSMILGERNRAKGAYCLSLEDFRVVFQFLSRVNVNYKRSVWIVLFSVSSKEDSELPRETIKEVFRSSLRQSDVVTHSSRNQYMILLLEMSPFNIEVVIDRIMNKWNACSELTGFELTYELDLLK